MENKKIDPTTVNGWGIDADPKDHPNYPIKKYTGDDHKRTHWNRPQLQAESVEVLMSTERPKLPAAYGTTLPPKGLSGMLRRFAFRYSENMYRHWLPLILADRIDEVEGIFSDIAEGHVPNVYKEAGWNVIAKHNKPLLAQKIVTQAAVLITTGLILHQLTKKKKKEKEKLFSF